MTPHVLDDQEPRPGLRPMFSVSTDTSDPVSSVEGDGYGSGARAGRQLCLIESEGRSRRLAALLS